MGNPHLMWKFHFFIYYEFKPSQFSIILKHVSLYIHQDKAGQVDILWFPLTETESPEGEAGGGVLGRAPAPDPAHLHQILKVRPVSHAEKVTT